MEKTIIAIDPGSRYWGVTIFKGRDIVLPMVKTFPTNGPLSHRLKRAGKAFLSLSDKYVPDILVIEKPFYFWSRQSKYLDKIIEEIKLSAKKRGMKIYEYSPMTVKKVISNEENVDKNDIATIICSIYPDLKMFLNQDKRSKEIYWSHIFGSTGLGICYLMSRKN